MQLAGIYPCIKPEKASVHTEAYSAVPPRFFQSIRVTSTGAFHAVANQFGLVPLDGRCHTRGGLFDLQTEFVGLISDLPLSGDAHVVYSGW